MFAKRKRNQSPDKKEEDHGVPSSTENLFNVLRYRDTYGPVFRGLMIVDERVFN